jgi:pimeloyl-ACP methyl ester carboxylesterase
MKRRVARPAFALALVALGAAVPRLLVRRDERLARPASGLGDPIPDLEESTVSTDDGASLCVVERGAGPPLVFVHGLALDHRSWHYQYLDLADRFRIVGVDLRGHGGSSVGSDAVGPHRFAADLAAVLEARDLRNAVVVGHSLGGTVVGQLCADHPRVVRDRVSGLVFVGTFASATAGEGWFRELISPTLIRFAASVRPERSSTGEASSGALAYLTARMPFGPRPQAEQVRFTLTMGATTSPTIVNSATLGNLAYDVREELGQCALPSLVVRGAHDTLSTERSAAQLRAALKDPEMVVFEDCGHLPMLEDRERFAEVVTDFALRVTGPPSSV